VYINRLAHDPNIGGTVFAAVTDGINDSVLRTVDGGSTWTDVLSEPGYMPFDVKVRPGNSDHVLAALNGGKVYFSASGGDAYTWDDQTTGAAGKLPVVTGRTEIAVVETLTGPVWYVGMTHNGGNLYRSNDGTTWVVADTVSDYLASQGYYNNALWADPLFGNIVIAGGVKLWRSTSYGQNLVDISTGDNLHADQHVIVEHPDYNGSTNKKVFVGNDGGIYRADDIEYALDGDWVNLNNGLGITQFYRGAAAQTGASFSVARKTTTARSTRRPGEPAAGRTGVVRSTATASNVPSTTTIPIPFSRRISAVLFSEALTVARTG
jgi:hypothetical protein